MTLEDARQAGGAGVGGGGEDAGEKGWEARILKKVLYSD